MVCTREEVLHEIEKDIKLTEQFYSWKEEQRQEFLDFCTGMKGIKLLKEELQTLKENKMNSKNNAENHK